MSKVEAMASDRFPIPQGTLDMLVLQALSVAPAHGYGLAQRLQAASREALRINQGSERVAGSSTSRAFRHRGDEA
jgi:hypothetical protein